MGTEERGTRINRFLNRPVLLGRSAFLFFLFFFF